MATLNVKLEGKIAKVEPDGSKCIHCGDVIYLAQWQYYFRVKGEQDWKPFANMAYCDSCMDFDRR